METTMSENQAQNTNSNKETRGFETEVKQLLNLMIHSLYSNKEIFLRELISNASDAVDKLRFAAIKKPELFANDTELNIEIDFDKDAKTITIRDNGIGMSKEEVIANLGTIARSGTQEFMKALTGDEAKDRNLIGQFGVGFYSSFIVADSVTVNTLRAGLDSNRAVRWTSKGEGEYSLEDIAKDKRGTEIILHLRDDQTEFLDDFRLRHIVRKYSDHINIPVKMLKVEPPKDLEDNAENKDENIEEVSVPEYEVVNEAKALWQVSKSDLTDEQYKEFYKHIAHDFEDPIAWAHNKVEGKLEYTTLLYVPSRAPFDMWQPNRTRGLKLYVQRVFIMDDAEQFLPGYLRFVRGVIDSNDLPLNISREILQSNRVVDSMKNAVTKRVLSTLSDLAKNDPEKYQQFWEEFGQALKEGPAEDYANKQEIAKLLRFSSTKTNDAKQTVSLEDYMSRMQAGQDKIYYMAAQTFNAAKNSPHLEAFRAKGIEVLLLSDRIDEWLMSHLPEFAGKHFKSVAQGEFEDLDFSKKSEAKSEDQTKEEAKAKDPELEKLTEEFAPTLSKIKECLKDKVEDVRLTKRLTDSPACVVAQTGQMTSQMQRLMRQAGQDVNFKPVLELNPEHMLVKRLQETKDQATSEDLSRLLLDQAILAEGGELDDPATFVRKFNDLLLKVAK